MEIHTIAFNKDKWTRSKAAIWLRRHNEIPIKPVHETTNYYRYRIRDPTLFRQFVTKKYPEGINIIFGIL
jgi:hypothetical protein